MQAEEAAGQQEIASQACGAEHQDPEDASTSEAVLPLSGDEHQQAQLLGPRDLAVQAASDPGCGRAMQLSLDLSDAEAGVSQRLADTPDASATSQLAAGPHLSSRGEDCNAARLAGDLTEATSGSRGAGAIALRGVREAAGDVQCVSGVEPAGQPAAAEWDDELDNLSFAQRKKQLSDAGQPAAGGCDDELDDLSFAQRREQLRDARQPSAKGCDVKTEELSFLHRREQILDAGQAVEKKIAEEVTQRVSMGSAGEAATACETLLQSPLARAMSSSQHKEGATASGSGAGSSHATATLTHMTEEASGSKKHVSGAPAGGSEPVTHKETGEAHWAPKRKGAPLGIVCTQKASKRQQPAQALGVAAFSTGSFAIVLDSGDEDDVIAVIDLT